MYLSGSRVTDFKRFKTTRRLEFSGSLKYFIPLSIVLEARTWPDETFGISKSSIWFMMYLLCDFAQLLHGYDYFEKAARLECFFIKIDVLDVNGL